MYQIIVSVMPTTFDPLSGPVTKRPHQWVSAHDPSLDVMLPVLNRHAARDMNFTDEEGARMSDIVKDCFAKEYKNTMVRFNDDEFLCVAILDEEDLRLREEALNELLGEGFGTGFSVRGNGAKETMH